MKYFIILLLLVSFKVDAQSDTNSIITISKSDVVLTLGFEFKHIYQSTPFDIHKIVDPEVNKYRIKDTLPYYSPIMHSSLYFGINYNLSFKNKYSLNFKTYFEQRNYSKGVNNAYTYKFFPEFAISIQDTIKANNLNVPFFFKMGDLYIQEEFTAGLRAYNIDIQGAKARLELYQFNLDFLYASDMAGGVGLQIGENISMKLSRIFSSKSNPMKALILGLSCDYDELISAYNGPAKKEFSYGLFLKFKLNKNFNIALISDQYIGKSNTIAKDFANSNALLVSVNYNYADSKNSITVSPKFRYYGSYYKYSNYDTVNPYISDYYRYRRSYPLYDGDYLYPIKNYFRPVSQYALYSEYLGDYNVYSFELFADWDWKFSNKFGHKLNVEIINIHRDSKDFGNQFTYVYYTSFLYYNFYKGFKGGIYISNKQMNRDVQYQTFYQMQTPFFGFHITYDGAFELLIKGKH